MNLKNQRLIRGQIQIARSEGQNEITQLKETISSLRNGIEDTKLRHEASVQKIQAGNQVEIQSLKNTISEIREELEQAKAEKDDAVQERYQNPKTRLISQNSLGMLREKLDFNQSRAEDRLQKAISEGNQKLEQFKKTISNLRLQLESKDLEKQEEVERTASRSNQRSCNSKTHFQL